MFKFKQKDGEFFDLFVESARFFHTGALMMDEVMSDYKKANDRVKQIIDLEHDADKVNDRIIDKLNMTFITPIDREDIYAIANGLDDGVDFLQGTIQRLVMYNAAKGRKGARNLTKLLIDASDQIITAFTLLKNIRKNQKKILEATHKIGQIESEGDRIFRKEVAKLFANEKDPIELIKWKDILENLEDTLDHCEMISDMIRGVVMKYA